LFETTFSLHAEMIPAELSGFYFCNLTDPKNFPVLR